jgi:hypothetical protein
VCPPLPVLVERGDWEGIETGDEMAGPLLTNVRLESMERDNTFTVRDI